MGAVRNETRQIPTAVIAGIGGVLAVTLLMSAMAAGSREAGEVETLSGQASKVLQERLFTAEDQSDGTIQIADSQSGEILETINRDSNGFIRGALRGLSRERKLRGVGSGEPFRLRYFGDGTLILDDPATSQIVALNGFGQDNAKAFGKYLIITTGE